MIFLFVYKLVFKKHTDLGFTYFHIEILRHIVLKKKIVNFYHKKNFHMDFLKVVWDIC